MIHNEESGNTRTEACPSATCSGTFRPHFRDITTCFCVVCLYVCLNISLYELLHGFRRMIPKEETSYMSSYIILTFTVNEMGSH